MPSDNYISPASNAQVRKLMEEMSKHGEIWHAVRNAGTNQKPARKYVKEGKLRSDMTMTRQCRTREEHQRLRPGEPLPPWLSAIAEPSLALELPSLPDADALEKIECPETMKKKLFGVRLCFTEKVGPTGKKIAIAS